MASAYWPDALDDRSAFVGTGAEFPRWVNEYHASGTTAHAHHITNHTCDLRGDTANTETYVINMLVRKEGTKINCGSARYIDRLEKRNGEWRIALRRIVFDFRYQIGTEIEEATWPWPGDIRKRETGKRDHSDISYMNPRTVSVEGKAKLIARGIKVP
jgi:hypothetical protein